MLVHDECPRVNWKLAMIEGLTTDNDGMVRSTNMQTKTGIPNRPVSKLYPLEVTAIEATTVQSQVTEEPENDQDDKPVMDTSSQVYVRQRCKATE